MFMVMNTSLQRCVMVWVGISRMQDAGISSLVFLFHYHYLPDINFSSTQCTRFDHSKKGLSCQYPRFLSERLSSIVMEKLQELFLLYCMTGTKWGMTPYPELEVFTEYLTRAGPNPTPNVIATTQQPTPPSKFISSESKGKRRAQSPTPTPASKKSKYDYMWIKPSTDSTPVTAHSTAGATTTSSYHYI